MPFTSITQGIVDIQTQDGIQTGQIYWTRYSLFPTFSAFDLTFLHLSPMHYHSSRQDVIFARGYNQCILVSPDCHAGINATELLPSLLVKLWSQSDSKSIQLQLVVQFCVPESPLDTEMLALARKIYGS